MPEPTNTLIFFPWLRLESPQIAGMRLVGYERDSPSHSADVHRILARYRTATGHPVHTATLVEVNGCVGGSVTQQDLERVFALQSLLAFSALASRTLFDQCAIYVNSHHFACNATPYLPGDEGVAVFGRRRDGPAILWHTEETYQVVCPPHVSAETSPELENGLLASLAANQREKWLLPAIELFNLANTDSPDVRSHTEVILTVAALQRAMGVEQQHRKERLAAAFVGALSTVPETRTLRDCKRVLPTQPAGSSRSLREVWFRDLYQTRGAFAHGDVRSTGSRSWTPEEHLCLASYIIPRLVMLRLSTLGLYQIPDERIDEIGAFDYLLCLRGFKPTEAEARLGQRLWSHSYFEATRMLRRDRLVAKAVASAVQADASK